MNRFIVKVSGFLITSSQVTLRKGLVDIMLPVAILTLSSLLSPVKSIFAIFFYSAESVCIKKSTFTHADVFSFGSQPASQSFSQSTGQSISQPDQSPTQQVSQKLKHDDLTFLNENKKIDKIRLKKITLTSVNMTLTVQYFFMLLLIYVKLQRLHARYFFHLDYIFFLPGALPCIFRLLYIEKKITTGTRTNSQHYKGKIKAL